MASTVDHIPPYDSNVATTGAPAGTGGTNAVRMPAQRGMSWNTHSIITRMALAHVDAETLDEPVPVLPIEDFLVAVQGGIRFLIGWYGEMLDRKTGVTGQARPIPRDVCTMEEFLRALRLNPDQRMAYVRVAHPSEVPPDTPHSLLRSGPPGPAYVHTSIHEKITPREILCTFSDEPDWGMDQDLFTIETYGYGPVPFGSRTGLSSQAPFHMAFLHEPAFLTILWPGLRQNFVEERIRVCLALARLAFRVESPYWAWRFVSWALHYMQDITQPYHAKAFPPSLVSLTRRFAADPHPRGFAKRNANLLRNHHVLFEAIAHYLLNDALKKDPSSRLAAVLSSGTERHAVTVGSFLLRETRCSASIASRCDKAMVRMVADKRLDAKDFTFTEGTDYRIDQVLHHAAQARPKQYLAFLDLLCTSLDQAGAVTRYCLRLVERLGHSSRSTVRGEVGNPLR